MKTKTNRKKTIQGDENVKKIIAIFRELRVNLAIFRPRSSHKKGAFEKYEIHLEI